MKTKIKGQKVNLKDWQSIKQLKITTFTTIKVGVKYEIQIFYPPIDGRIQRKTFTYEKEKSMLADYQKLIIKVLLK